MHVRKTYFTCTTLRLPLLLTLNTLTDRVGCYNVREKKLIVRKLTSTVNSYGIATFSVRGEGLRFFDFLKCMNAIFPGISNDYNGFATSENALYVHFPRHGDKRSAARDERIRRTGEAGDRGKLE